MKKTKYCPKCKRDLPFKNFNQSQSTGRYVSYCKPCNSVVSKATAAKYRAGQGERRVKREDSPALLFDGPKNLLLLEKAMQGVRYD